MEKNNDDGGGGVDAGGSGGIGAGGGKSKGKNIPNAIKAEAEARRKAQQDVVPQQDRPLRDFGDGSRLLKDWSHSHNDLLGEIIKQLEDICWALALALILQFTYNMGRPIAEQQLLDINGFVEKVKLTPEERNARKKLGPRDMAVGSLKRAIDHIFDIGLEKLDRRKKKEKTHNKVFTVKGRFLEVEEATPQQIAEKVEQGLVGLIVDDALELRKLKEGIYMVPKPQVGAYKHALTVIAYGTMRKGDIFFEVQTTWGVNGRGRIVLSSTCHMFYLDEVLDGKKKKTNAA